VPRVVVREVRGLWIVDRCPFYPKPHYYSASDLRCQTAADGTVEAHCRDNRRRDRADRRYLLIEPLPALQEQLPP
jgi:hypothetical protein